MRNTLYLTDCEGPISKNDNAFELGRHFIPDGGAFFAKLSRYDDFLADIEKKPGYKAGDTLRLIAPFLKAYGVTDAAIREFSSEGLLLVPRADEMLRAVSGSMPTYIISTSYRP
jgi:energy-converting hydrogenase A subunit R